MIFFVTLSSLTSHPCAAQGFAFGKSRGIQIPLEGELFPDFTQGFSTICETLVSYQCNLGFTVYRSHCGFSKLFPCTSRKLKSVTNEVRGATRVLLESSVAIPSLGTHFCSFFSSSLLLLLLLLQPLLYKWCPSPRRRSWCSHRHPQHRLPWWWT